MNPIKDITPWLNFLESNYMYVHPFVLLGDSEEEERPFWLEWIPELVKIEKYRPLQEELMMRWRMAQPEISEKQKVSTWLELPMASYGKFRIPIARCNRSYTEQNGQLGVARIFDGALWTILPFTIPPEGKPS